MPSSGSLELLGKRLPEDQRLSRLVSGAMAAAERGATLTRRLLAFARRQELSPEAVDVALLVEGMLDMLSRSLGPAVQIRTEFQAEVGPVKVDPNQLELALLNLALNARDAMPLGGSVIIGGRCANEDEPRALGLAEARFVCITVADTGSGMDSETLKRATEPFFTTKGTGKGTGLGLSMVHGLVAQSGGAMRLTSTPAVGTTVELWLPLAERPTGITLAPVATAAIEVPPCRILLVDDDSIVLAGTVAMLEDLGHSVVDVGSATQALELLGRPNNFDLVITDHAMPAMTGSALAERIEQVWPNLPVILATGYADLTGGINPSLPRLNKPFRSNDLAGAIAAALRSVAPTGTNVVSLNVTRRV